ncbi:kynureninase [Sphingopyxis sp. KK2]|uniref:kynureninase n=1 Tax=Sphingopyxis sp. KK2 TaxID=1855727 RepID=UPI00097E574B|nr:aminotransferase class V-fold PLP-dependent enzyme [Sphingopyxis sp. KK2]
MDAADPLAPLRDHFVRPPGPYSGGLIYLDGNSLGMLPHASAAASADLVTRQWGERLIRSWNEGWIDAPERIGGLIAPLVGAAPDEVIVCDSTSVNLFKAIVAGLREAGRRDPRRRVVLSEAGNFHTDLHIAAGAVGCVPGAELRVVARDELAAALADDVAILLLTHVHYKSGERFAMAEWTARAQAAGALMLWDLSHSAGAVAVDLDGAGADLAVGCGYKYLNGGPGAPAFLFVARRWQAVLANPLSGWMGHAAPFAFTDDYAPAAGMKRWLTGTPPLLAMQALESGLALWRDVDMAAVEAKSAALFDILFAAGERAGLECVTPRDPAARGSHIGFRHPQAYALIQALIARGIVGDFRAPDVARFGLTPLTLSHEELWLAGEALVEVIAAREWDRPAFRERAAVT